MAGAYQTSGFAYQGAGQFAYQDDGVSPPTINWQEGGAGHPVYRKRRKKTKQLFDSIERTIRETVFGTESKVLVAHKVQTDKGLDEALRQLTISAQGYEDLSLRVEQIRAEISAYEARKRREIDDDDDDFLMMAD